MFHHRAYQHCIRICLLLALFTACTKTLPTPEAVTIKFPYFEPEAAYYTTLVEQFKTRYPYITVELVKLDWRSYEQGNYLNNDVFVASQLMLPSLIQQGAILDLSPLIEQDTAFDKGAFFPGALDVFHYEGKTWGIPSTIDMVLMYYNKELFDLYGVPYPTPNWTWDDFLERATEITDPNSNVFGYAVQYSGNMALMEPVMFIYQHGGQLFNDWRNPTQITFNHPLNIEAMNWYAGLIYQHGVAPTSQQGPKSTRSYPYGGIAENKYGMWMGMLSEQNNLGWITRRQMRVGVVPLPRDRTAITLATVNGFFVSAKTLYPDACWKWLMFLSEQMPTSNLPARKALAESGEYAQLVGIEVAEASRTAVRDAVLINPGLSGFEQAMNVLNTAFTAIREGQASADAALTAAQEQVNF